MWGSTQVLQSLRPPDNVLVSRKETPASTVCLHQKARRKVNQGVRLMLSLLLPLSLRRSLSGTRSHPSCLHHPQGQPNPHTHGAYTTCCITISTNATRALSPVFVDRFWWRTPTCTAESHVSQFCCFDARHVEAPCLYIGFERIRKENGSRCHLEACLDGRPNCGKLATKSMVYRSLIRTSSRCRAHPTREADVPCTTRRCKDGCLNTACSCETSSVQPCHQGIAVRETSLRTSTSGSKN